MSDDSRSLIGAWEYNLGISTNRPVSLPEPNLDLLSKNIHCTTTVRQNMLTQPRTESYDLCHSSCICVHVIKRVLRVQETRNCQSGSFHDRAQ